jgi:hypothetical protein
MVELTILCTDIKCKDMVTAIILAISLYLSVKYYNVLNSWMNKIFKWYVGYIEWNEANGGWVG